jgi:hypothetical protein
MFAFGSFIPSEIGYTVACHMGFRHPANVAALSIGLLAPEFESKLGKGHRTRRWIRTGHARLARNNHLSIGDDARALDWLLQARALPQRQKVRHGRR